MTLIKTETKIKPLSQRYTGQFCQTALNCSKNYYGDTCSTFCLAADTCQMHTTCDYYGNLTCIAGWGLVISIIFQKKNKKIHY